MGADEFVPPLPDIKANGSDGPVKTTPFETLRLTVAFAANEASGLDADWWLLAKTPSGLFHYELASGWVPGKKVSLQKILMNFPSRPLRDMPGLTYGTYLFYFGVDLIKNGRINLNQGYYDKVKVVVN
ncbi:MAG: hypothetical protein JXB23_01210 [Candidatus Aminicenantes bacterium]|nr:hypothetical protein [Candidatus Aminicenantes bacterium]